MSVSSAPATDKQSPPRWRNAAVLLLGPLAGLVLYLVLPYSLAPEGRAVAGIALWMALWWMTEAAPIPVTSLIPLVAFPLVGAGAMKEVAAPYADPVIFLVMGGVILGLATERSNLHLRVALYTIKVVGTKPAQIVFGLMLASAFISAWVSNTATAVIMTPIAVSVLELIRRIDKNLVDAKFAAAMVLGVAYGVTIGSTATLIGQPPMALMKAYLAANHDFDVPFGQWMLVGVPFAVIMLVLTWIVLTKLVFRTTLREIPGGKELINSEIHSMGPMSQAEKRVAIIFVIAIVLWVSVPFLADSAAVSSALPFITNISDTQIAIGAAIACFLVPAGRTAPRSPLLQWSASKEIPWGLLLLFGGGLSLSAAFTSTGFSKWIGEQVAGLGGLPPFFILLAVAVIGLALTELTSNTATAAAFFPIMGAVAIGIGIDPLLMTMVVTLAVCSAYMLPVATPSNAVAFGSGEVSIRQMVRAGIWLNVISLAVVMGVVYTLVPAVFGVHT